MLATDIVDSNYSLESLHELFLTQSAVLFSLVGLVFVLLPRLFASSRSSASGTAPLPGNGMEGSSVDLIMKLLSAAMLAAWYGTGRSTC